MSTKWHPEGIDRRYGRSRPEVGDVVAYDRRAWEVRHVTDADPTSKEADRLAHYRPEYRDQHKPYSITLRRLHGAQHKLENSARDIGVRINAGAFGALPAYPNGRVPLCSCCSHPWPCAEADQQRLAEGEMARAEKAMRVLPGFCPACEEPVTRRQRSIRFPGEHVGNPFAASPVYHLRRKCWMAAAAYEEKWVAADPRRERSLLTLACPGHVTVHHDGTAECHGRNDGSECPSIHAQHRGYSACYFMSHGCPQDCPAEGHPGTRVAGRPDDPRQLT